MLVPSQPPVKAFNKIAFVGEAPGAEEDHLGQPFVGPSGQLFDSLLRQAQIDRLASYVGNVFTQRPPNNRIETFFRKPSLIAGDLYASDSVPKGTTIKMLKGEVPPLPCVVPWLAWPKYGNQGHLKPPLAGDLLRLQGELSTRRPNVVVALGATALWALCGLSAIGTYRGTLQESTLVKGLKVLPTFHPAATLRDWSQRPIVIADLLKAKAEAATPELKLPERRIYLAECFQDVERFAAEHLAKASHFSFDVETSQGTITLLSLSPRPEVSLVVPFYGLSKLEHSTFGEEEEVKVWRLLKSLFEDPTKKKVAHNSLYDLTYLRLLSIFPNNVEDTMFLHHAHDPELPKSLGFLASLYCQEGAWKTMRNAPKRLLNKAND